MKKPRHGSLHIKIQSNDDNCKGGKNNKSSNKGGKSLFELSLSLIFSLWCLVFLFYSKLGLGHGNGGMHLDSNFVNTQFPVFVS